MSSCVQADCYLEFVGFDVFGNEIYEEVCYY